MQRKRIMPRNLLPPHKLTISEKLLVGGFWLSVLGAAGAAAGMAFDYPLPVLGAAAALRWFYVQRRKSRATSGVHGTAHFATEEEAAAAGLTGQTEGMILGVGALEAGPDNLPPALTALRTPMRQVAKLRLALERHCMGKRRRPLACDLVRLPGSDKLAHTAVYMPSGAGKTRGEVIPNLLCNDENAVIYDPSGETFFETAEYRRSNMGHEIRLIDPFRVCSGQEPDQLNVLDLLNHEDWGCFDYACNLAHALVPEKTNTNQDPFWHNSTVVATATLLYAIMKASGDPHRNLGTLTELLSAKRLQELAQALSKSSDELLRRRAEQMLNFQGKTLTSLLACMSAEHGWMDSPAFERTLADSTFSVRDLFRKKMSLYVVIPGNRALESQQFVRTVLTAILYAAFEAGPDVRRPPVRFWLDEAATLGRLDALMMLYSQGRKFGLRSVTFFQSVAQVAEIMGTPDRVHTFRSCMAAELFKVHDYASAKEVADWIGQTTVRTMSTSEQEGRNTGWSNSTGGSHASSGRSGGTSEGWSVTRNETGVPLIRPEQILQLGAREAIALIAGVPPVKVRILHGNEAAQCADSSAVPRYQRKFLRRVRLHALLFWFGGGFFLLGTAAAFQLMMRPSLPPSAVHPAPLPEPPYANTRKAPKYPSLNRNVHGQDWPF